MPWRQDTRPYYVFVSELMLQQTQVDRVIPKFNSFIEQFPNEEILAEAPLADVLRAWQGLGYNRRAKFLHEVAKHVHRLDKFPDTESELIKLPGVGKNTAGAIVVYSLNKPTLFIETNVRAVYIHHFFGDVDSVDDSSILEKMRETVPWMMERTESLPDFSPRDFYWALMDYGSWLKKEGIGPNRSRHYKKQAPLKGSVREVRGQIIRELSRHSTTFEELQKTVINDHRFDTALSGLIKDGLVSRRGNNLYLTK